MTIARCSSSLVAELVFREFQEKYFLLCLMQIFQARQSVIAESN